MGRLVRFTRPDGRPCFIDPDTVEEVTVAAGTGHSNANTCIACEAATQYVTEGIEDVIKKLGKL
jgi:hypothetical protein